MTEKQIKTFDVVFMKPTELKPYFQNNKVHSKRQILLLARAVRTYGFDQPIVVDKELVIIKGHGRWLAALELRYPQVPVVVRDDLSDNEVRASRIADNQAFAMSAVDELKSRQEVESFVQDGGVGAEYYFDFLQPGKVSNMDTDAGGAQVQSVQSIAGALVTCPKCHHVQMEV